MANIGSIVNMFNHIGFKCEETNNLDKISKSKKLILPGVGSFDNAMKKLASSGIKDVLNQKVIEEKTPILGICLGMQLFAKNSEEGSLQGLGWLDANVLKFKPKREFKVPHMGWNEIKIRRNSPLSENLKENSRFYFVHSYYFKPNNKKDLIFQTNYSFPFASGVNFNNIFGVQFHPEKSHKYGMKLLKNFGNL